MQIISAKTPLRDVSRHWTRTALALDAPAEAQVLQSGDVAVLVAARPRWLRLFRRPRPMRLGLLEPGLARLVAPLIETRKRLRVRLVDVPPPHSRGGPGAPVFCVSIWGETGGAARGKARDGEARAGKAAVGKAAADASADAAATDMTADAGTPAEQAPLPST